MFRTISICDPCTRTMCYSLVGNVDTCYVTICQLVVANASSRPVFQMRVCTRQSWEKAKCKARLPYLRWMDI
jgi:hypothetical protein